MRVHGPERRGPLPRVRDGGCGPAGGPPRYTDLQRQIPGLSQRVLTHTLRRLVEDGLIARSAYAEIPPRVEYALAPLGCGLHEIVTQLIRWAADHNGETRTHRSRWPPAPPRRAEAACTECLEELQHLCQSACHSSERSGPDARHGRLGHPLARFDARAVTTPCFTAHACHRCCPDRCGFGLLLVEVLFVPPARSTTRSTWCPPSAGSKTTHSSPPGGIPRTPPPCPSEPSPPTTG
ncbi:winged helix-turn-helix transcriptional regulator [Streptomyces sp. NPDC048405]|uniref:winged helix-turn-helix transcriptional regulator n=1 Tax=unclassified Streptomyces TaxID=2593676 RepID=UPI003721DD33